MDKLTATDRRMIISTCFVPADRSYQILCLPRVGSCGLARICSGLVWIDGSKLHTIGDDPCRVEIIYVFGNVVMAPYPLLSVAPYYGYMQPLYV